MLVPMAGTPTNIEGGARCVSSARRDLCGDEEKSSSLPRPSPDTGSLEKFSAFVPRTLVYKLSICEAYRLGKEKIQCVYCSEFGSHRRSNRPAALSLATGLDRTGGGHAHVGPIDFMGTCGLTNYVITTEAAHILIDGAMPQTAASVEASIRKLGFSPRTSGCCSSRTPMSITPVPPHTLGSSPARRSQGSIAISSGSLICASIGMPDGGCERSPTGHAFLPHACRRSYPIATLPPVPAPSRCRPLRPADKIPVPFARPRARHMPAMSEVFAGHRFQPS